ncbi:MAG: anthranilate synthase component I family protein [Nitrospirae bacterium]|nr:anthranilate synthase component I family protein [Nitrospirota bacterium]
MKTEEMTHPPVFREIPFESPFEVYQKLRSKNSFLFESVKGPDNIARYSFIGIEPYLVFRAKDGTVEIEAGGKKTISSRKPLDRLRELVKSYSQPLVKGLPPFQGGAAGMLSYDFVQYLEKLPQKAVDDLNIPDAHFFMIDRLVAFDHLEKKSWIVVCPGVRDTVLGYTEIMEKHEAYSEEALKVIESIHERISKEKATAPGQQGGAGEMIRLRYDTGKEDYMAMVGRAKEYIAAGDIFQSNLSLRVTAGIGELDPWELYTILRQINPSPFSCFADFGEYSIVSSSPERLVRVSGRTVDTRPIAGTRPRGRDLSEDDEMRAELLLNEKERAEHIMLIDLERNDLGRVSDYGTVVVDELMVTEDYSHVMHIVSNVKGALAEGKDCFDVIKATFPGGTITGVPKVRCMEIIDELEPTRRGPYTGSVGYIGFNGNMDLNIIIRTFLIKEGKAYIQAGAGIVADSDPEREYHECIKKAEALIRTLEKI